MQPVSDRLAARRIVRSLASVAVGCVASACVSQPNATRGAPGDVRWDAIVAYEGDASFERIRIGHPDASDPRPAIVGVDQGGTVVLIRLDGEVPTSQVLHRTGAELTGLAIVDVDADVPGDEIYVGGYASAVNGGTGGVVLQLVVTPDGVRSRRVYEGDAYVHALERIEPSERGAPARLLVTTYAGELKLLTPSPGAGTWASETIYKDPPASDPETLKFKDIALLRPASGGPPREALAVMKTGRVIHIDLDRPGSGRLVHTEQGGLSRVSADPDGGAFMTGYWGRVLHFVREGAGFRIDVMDHEGKESGLRGIVQGRFPVAGGVAPLAIFGYHKLVRALTPRHGAWDTTTIFLDSDRGHAMECADLVPGNDADEIVVGGYGNRITILVARR